MTDISSGKNDLKDHVIVIGGGVIGVTTAYELARRNVPVTLIEAGPDLALETSFANGGMMTPSQAEPWNSPGVFGHLVASLFDPQAALKLRVKALPGLVSWGLQFLLNATPKKYQRATLHSYRLAAYSALQTAKVTKQTSLFYDRGEGGTLKVFTNRSALETSVRMSAGLTQSGLRYRVLSVDEAMQVEPALSGCQSHLVGAIHYPDDSCGDVRAFTKSLAKQAQEVGAVIHLNTRAVSLLLENNKNIGVKTNVGDFLGTVILAAGCSTPTLAGSAGLRIPIQPAKGYSISLDTSGIKRMTPKIPVLDEALHTAVTPIGSLLRVVGTAEFAGYDTFLSPDRLANLRQVFERLYPNLAASLDWNKAVPWAGLRPMSADGLPFIGPAGMPGIWINGGHGHLGWTMAMGSAALLVDQMQGNICAIDPAPYACTRF